ncbi:MAG: leucyl aminopeptidase family protein [Pseudomonadota bacterium]
MPTQSSTSLSKLLIDKSKTAKPVAVVRKAGWKEWLTTQAESIQTLAENSGFQPDAGAFLALPTIEKGGPVAVIVVDDPLSVWDFGGLAFGLAAGDYALSGALTPQESLNAALGWALGGYSFTRYKKAKRKPARLVVPQEADAKTARRIADGVGLTRDLINTPAADMGPAELAESAKSVAEAYEAKFSAIVGKDLLKKNYPAVHAVGRASNRDPRLIDISWSPKRVKKSAPKIVIVGKGVCFDSGGLDLKPSAGMLTMKKDMGGAAHALALAQMIMDAKLPVHLRLLIPAVENSVSGNAFRPLDVLDTRKGLTVEVGNTDAEGRIILCDALAEGDGDKPDMMIDFATLTGAARVALGTELPALFCNNDDLARDFVAASNLVEDPIWRMPLHKPYRRLLDSKVAHMNNISSGPFGGAITAALFLEEFISATTPWAHIDVMAWNTGSKRGRPEGGEAMSLRAAYELITGRYGT